MFFWISLTIIGHIFVFQTLQKLCEKYKLQKLALTKFGTIVFGAHYIISFLVRQNFVAQLAWIIALILLLQFCDAILKNRLLSIFRGEIIFLIDEIIILMRSGHSFRNSLEMYILAHQGFVKYQTQEILNIILAGSVPINLRSPRFIQEILKEFMLIDQNPHKAVDQLKQFRKKLKLEADFRRRSVIASMQTKIQSIVLSILYVSLMSFVIHQYGFQRNATLILISNVLFLIGMVWIFNTGRRIQWKV